MYHENVSSIYLKIYHKNKYRNFLVVQWLRILPIQGMWVWFLPPGSKIPYVMGPMCHNEILCVLPVQQKYKKNFLKIKKEVNMTTAFCLHLCSILPPPPPCSHHLSPVLLVISSLVCLLLLLFSVLMNIATWAVHLKSKSNYFYSCIQNTLVIFHVI